MSDIDDEKMTEKDRKTLRLLNLIFFGLYTSVTTGGIVYYLFFRGGAEDLSGSAFLTGCAIVAFSVCMLNIAACVHLYRKYRANPDESTWSNFFAAAVGCNVLVVLLVMVSSVLVNYVGLGRTVESFR